MHTARHNETGPENRACFLKRQVSTFFWNVQRAASRLETALKINGVEHDVKEYPDAGHAFLNTRRGYGVGDGEDRDAISRALRSKRSGAYTSVFWASPSLNHKKTQPASFKGPVKRTLASVGRASA